MEQIKLEHLAPYLPYMLNYAYRCAYSHENDFTKIMTSDDLDTIIISSYHFPILKPLSDLTDDKTRELFKSWSQIDCVFDWKNLELFTYERLSYEVVETLLKNHFDVFGLIEKGLAIDINKIEKS